MSLKNRSKLHRRIFSFIKHEEMKTHLPSLNCKNLFPMLIFPSFFLLKCILKIKIHSKNRSRLIKLKKIFIKFLSKLVNVRMCKICKMTMMSLHKKRVTKRCLSLLHNSTLASIYGQSFFFENN